MKLIGVQIEHQRAYARRLIEGIIRFAQQQNDWSLSLLEWDDIEHRERIQHFNGFITRITDANKARIFEETGKPVVDVLQHATSPLFGGADQNARLIGQLAVRYFLQHRFTRFAFCGHEGKPYSDRRRAAFVECLRLNHFRCSVYPTPASVIRNFDSSVMRIERYTPRGEIKSLCKWAEKLEKPVAVFCSHDLRAHQLIKACIASGIKVPDETAVLGVDNDDFICNFTEPNISSIDPDAENIGFAAADTLYQMLKNPGTPPPPLVKVKPKGLVERASTRTYPVDPPWLSDALVFISTNVAHRISASDVFAHLNKSHSTVDDAFRRVLGHTVSKAIFNSRIEEATRLLRTSTRPITEISRLSGFDSVQYFTNLFTKTIGKSPSLYRADFHRQHPLVHDQR